MSLWAVFATGLLAGGASCAAVQGGLLAGLVARRHTPVPAVAGPGRRRRPAPPPPPTLSEGAVPVGGFLLAKLVSHTLLGALLGLLGDAVQIGFRTRAVLQVAAGVLMLVLAADLLGVHALRRVVPAPPAAWGRLVRRSARWGGGFAPALLGFATVLIPCGVTLSMEFLAVASGSPLAGAAIMATFVVGTSPLFAAIGFAASRSARAMRGRLALLAGAAVLVAGLFSLNAGLTLWGSPVTIASAWRSVTAGQASPVPVEAAPLSADGVQRIVIGAGGGGYSPSTVRARAGVPTEIIVRVGSGAGCTRSIIFPDFGVQEILGTGDNTLDVGEMQAGTHRFTCGMGMYGGTIEAV